MTIYLFIDNELKGPVREMVPDQQGSGYNITVDLEPGISVYVPNGEVGEASLRPASDSNDRLVLFEKPRVHQFLTKTAPLIVKITSSTRLSIHDINDLLHS